jgi:type III pantothenate kinase
MINLVVDVGNTYTKLAVFRQDELLHTGRFESLTTTELNNWIAEYGVQRLIISSVKTNVDDWQQTLQPQVPVTVFNRKMQAGIHNHYGTPETLGLDRLAAIIGAARLYPGQSALVIDGGTCITYDWIDARANYYGGSISPGLNMRYKALQHYTAALPLITADSSEAAGFGTDTASAMRTGVQNGIKYELEGFIRSFSEKEPGNLTVILSGGDSLFFDTLLKNSIFAPSIVHEPYLVLKGLNAAIQEHND